MLVTAKDIIVLKLLSKNILEKGKMMELLIFKLSEI